MKMHRFGKNLALVGDCREAMRLLISSGLKVQMCVTSPPYWGLRDYGVQGQIGQEPVHDCLGWATGTKCGECHICVMVEVFGLVRDLLADDGTLWVNYGDCYASAGGNLTPMHGAAFDGRTRGSETICRANRAAGRGGLKSKDLAMMPARLALALQADGWYLRQDIIWHKPNPMPESAKDRFTKAHEYIFLLSKQERYYFDQNAVKEPVTGEAHARGAGVNPKAVPPTAGWARGPGAHSPIVHAHENRQGNHGTKFRQADSVRNKQNESFSAAVRLLVERRNKRSVWTVASEPFHGGHFATFPTGLIEPCVAAGSYPGSIVLDPFFGSGTTGEVAQQLGRYWVGIDINGKYLPYQEARTSQLALMV